MLDKAEWLQRQLNGASSKREKVLNPPLGARQILSGLNSRCDILSRGARIDHRATAGRPIADGPPSKTRS